MKSFTKIAGVATMAAALSVPSFALAQADISTLTCAEFLALDQAGMTTVTEQLTASGTVANPSSSNVTAGGAQVDTSSNEAADGTITTTTGTEDTATSSNISASGEQVGDVNTSTTDTTSNETATTDANTQTAGAEAGSEGDAQGGNATTDAAQEQGGTAGAATSTADASTSGDMGTRAMAACAGKTDERVVDALAM